MKSISAAIVVLAAAILITGGSFIQHGDTRLFVQAVGCAVGLLALWQWTLALKAPERHSKSDEAQAEP
jgi:hypothetical protein